MPITMRSILLSVFVLGLLANPLLGELSLPHFFSDHMILQREKPAAIWGKASPKTEVKVTFKGKTVVATSDEQGAWRVQIETGAADAKGSIVSIRSGTEKVDIQDVLVGEVWLASGQSNMYFTMNRVPAYEPLMAKSDYPGLRMFNAPLVTAVEPQHDIAGEWTACTPQSVPGFSAVAFFFARKLHQELGIPVGVIKTAWGGKPVETFTSREALNTLPGTKKLVDALLLADSTFDPALAEKQYSDRLAQWDAETAALRQKPPAERTRKGKKPTPARRPLDTEGQPGVLFDSMIHPFVGYTMRGAIWYQGEGNAKVGAVPYDETLPLMIRDWRKRWGDEFSFYFVQLANYRAVSTEPGTPDPWPLLQDRMRRILETTPKTGMAVINDVGEANDIHPKDKQSPGERLARWALAKDYGRDLVYSSPLFASSTVDGESIRIRFDHAGEGLKSRDGGPLKRFEIAGADRVWHWAEAKVDGKSDVLVSSPQVVKPVAVRYAWASNPEGANLVNSEGLPASVFRTDDWPDVEDLAPAAKAAEGRRAMATEIKALNANLAKMDRNSDEAKALRNKVQDLMAKFKESSPRK